MIFCQNYSRIEIIKYILSTIFIVIASAVFFSGCVDEEQTQVVAPTSTQVVTPTLSPTPTITVVTSVPIPIPTPAPKIFDIPIKAGYTLYQNNEYNYGFGYPNIWDMGDGFGLSDNQLQGVGISRHYINPASGKETVTGMGVVVFSSDPKLWDAMGGLDNLTRAGYIKTARNTTVNGRKAVEVVPGAKFMPDIITRYVTIQANGYYYVMNLFTSAETYTTESDRFDDIVNSWVIANIS